MKVKYVKNGNSCDVGPIGFTLDYLERLKVKITNVAVTAIGMWGYTPVRTTCVLVFLCVRRIFCKGYLMRWRRAMKFCRLVDLRVGQVISPFGELWPWG